jgi:PPOX class probable F420-dependent enzyme
MTDHATTTAPVPAETTSAPLPDHIRAFLAEPNFATIATVGADGTPNQAVIWYRFEGDHIVINSAIGRRWPANLLRDPRVSVAVIDRHDGLRWVGFTSQAEAIRDQPTAQADIAEMARRYHADDPEEGERIIRERFQRQERISFRIDIGAVHDHLS